MKVTDKNRQRGGATTASSLSTQSAKCRKDIANASTTTATYAPTATMASSNSNARIVSSPWRSFRERQQLGTVSVDYVGGGEGEEKMDTERGNKRTQRMEKTQNSHTS